MTGKGNHKRCHQLELSALNGAGQQGKTQGERERGREGTENDQKMIRNDLNNDDEAKDIATRHSLLLSLPGSSLPSPAPVPLSRLRTVAEDRPLLRRRQMR